MLKRYTFEISVCKNGINVAGMQYTVPVYHCGCVMLGLGLGLGLGLMLGLGLGL